MVKTYRMGYLAFSASHEHPRGSSDFSVTTAVTTIKDDQGTSVGIGLLRPSATKTSGLAKP